jgi:hypothetical protein
MVGLTGIEEEYPAPKNGLPRPIPIFNRLSPLLNADPPEDCAMPTELITIINKTVESKFFFISL